jgi:hypothetical protein
VLPTLVPHPLPTWLEEHYLKHDFSGDASDNNTAAFVFSAHMAYDFDVPTISSFFGIVIQMFWREHAPPHFHALYAEFEVEIDIRTLEVIKGSLPRRALALVLEWAVQHRTELMEDWNLCQSKLPPKRIEPLE